MIKDALGERMKRYEAAYNAIYPIRFPLILRLDGVHFHSQVKKWKCSKPFDPDLIETMHETTKYLCESIPGAQIAYTQSDEITILVRDDMSLMSQPWFNKEVNKILSDSASKATKAFIYNYFFLKKKELPGIEHFPEFDCRGYIVPEHEVLNAFLWRQKDCEKNSIQMMARSKFSHKQLEGKTGNQMQEMLFGVGINWNDTPVYLKRGACIIKVEVPGTVPDRDERGQIIPGKTKIVHRNKWHVDYTIPIFNKDKNYINRHCKISSTNVDEKSS